MQALRFKQIHAERVTNGTVNTLAFDSTNAGDLIVVYT